MIALEGPAVQEIQLAFVEDWYFLTQHLPDLNWNPGAGTSEGEAVLVLPSGPADKRPTCSMMFTQIIHAAERRLWITSPYFVPDQEIVRALQLAALRGVDVRILLPSNPDHLLVYWASFTYLEELDDAGVRFFRYTKGLLHEKVVLADDRLAAVGSANADNRSFYLNFEVTVIAAGPALAADVASMLQEDFAHGRTAGSEEFAQKGRLFHLVARLSRLLSPIL
jgi:cardiolipin synthase